MCFNLIHKLYVLVVLSYFSTFAKERQLTQYHFSFLCIGCSIALEMLSINVSILQPWLCLALAQHFTASKYGEVKHNQDFSEKSTYLIEVNLVSVLGVLESEKGPFLKLRYTVVVGGWSAKVSLLELLIRQAIIKIIAKT